MINYHFGKTQKGKIMKLPKILSELFVPIILALIIGSLATLLFACYMKFANR